MAVVPFQKLTGVFAPNGCRGARTGRIAQIPCIQGDDWVPLPKNSIAAYCPPEMRGSFCTNTERQPMPTPGSPNIGGQVYPTGGSPFPTPEPICSSPM